MDTINEFAKQAAASAAISDTASKATIVGGAGTSIYTIFGGDMTLSFIGIICTVGTFIINWVFKRREYKLNERRLEMEYEMKMLAEQRRQQESDARIMAMQSGYIPPQNPPDTAHGATL